jgi:hypothetical protein
VGLTRSAHKATVDRIEDALAAGKHAADIVDVALDRQFTEQSRHDWCWLSWQNVPPDTGWYEIDRQGRRLTRLSAQGAAGLEWHERLFAYPSALIAAKDRSPLALYIGDEYEDGRLSALYLCGPDVLASVAQKDA